MRESRSYGSVRGQGGNELPYSEASMKKQLYTLCVATLAGLCLGTMIGCTPTHLDPQSLNDYVMDESNGLIVRQQAGGLDLSVTYRPNDLMVHQSLEASYDEQTLQRLREQYGAFTYFVLSMQVGGKDVLYGTSTGQADFSAKLQTLSYRMQEVVSIITSAQDTIPVADYAYPRNFGRETSSNLLFAFSSEKLKSAEWFNFHLKEFGMKTGDQRFRFRVSDLEATPKVPFQPIASLHSIENLSNDPN
ncbi:MAG: hypothetical protein AAGA66_07830 [Bacteroidota bacterium]